MNKEYRMYNIVLSALNPMQKGIQALHSTVEYVNSNFSKEDCKQWVNTDKTVITLDGGTVQELNEIISSLNYHNVKFSYFREPDLGELITSISFLVSNDIYELTKEEMEFDIEDSAEKNEIKWMAQMLSSLRLAR